MIASDLFHPDYQEVPLWWEDARPSSDGSGSLPKRADVLVVGSGYAGLSAALELARSGREAVVVEAAEFGFGGSTRNGGQASGGFGFADPGAADQEAMLARVKSGVAAIEFLEALIEREGIDARYQPSGKYVAAHSPRAFEQLRRKAEVLQSHAGLRVRVVEVGEQSQELGSRYYFGGVLVEPGGLVQPALLHRGMLQACRRAGVALCAATRVLEISGERGNLRLKTNRGTCTAREVVIASNGYTGGATPRLQRRVIPVSSYIIATEPLDLDLARRLMPGNRAISDTHRLLTYFRLSPDGRRMVFGGRAQLSETPVRLAAERLYAFMIARFPELRGARITHAWTGFVAFAFDRRPHMGLRDGLHYCLCCNGSGVAMMTYLGYCSARRIVEPSAVPICAFDDQAFPTRPFYRGRPWFLPTMSALYRTLDSLDRFRFGEH